MLPIGTIIGIMNWCLTLISIFIFLFIFLIYIKLVKEGEDNDVSIRLTMNTCLAAFLTSITVITMVSSNIFNGFLLFNMNFCYVWGLFYDILECSIYYSYSLQAFYRLFRVIYYKKKFLASLKLYKMLIFCQWFFSIILILITLFLKWYIHLPTEKYCLIPYTNLIGSIYLIVILYSIPLLTIIIIYILITKHIRSSSSTTIIRIRERERNLRDLTVIKRIILSVFMLIILRFPTIIFILFGVINGYLYSLTYAIVGFVTAICLILIGLITISSTNQFKNHLFRYFNHQIHPLNTRVQQTVETTV
jgi:hypothetical protein